MTVRLVIDASVMALWRRGNVFDYVETVEAQ